MPSPNRHALDRAHAVLDGLTGVASLLVLPLSVLLFAQWPLRELVGSGSRPANDLAQWVFALYVALALRQTTRVRGHMATDVLAGRYPSALREGVQRWGPVICVLPWAAFVLASGAPTVWRSVLGLESFPDTANPLYFVIKFSAWLLALLIGLQTVLDALHPAPSPQA
jgi:TRAP-type C4-dicarboxylate transport system permease small subunit